MHYLIDGYNLLHHVGRLLGNRPANLELARLDLLRLLLERFGDEASSVTVVYDAQGAPPTVRDRQDHGGIDVRFTRFEEADDLIEALIRQAAAPEQLTVVSNDRRIKEAARRRRCPVVECVEFWASLTQKPEPSASPCPATEAERPALSPEEIAAWQKEFGDLDSDAGFKELFGPDFEEKE
jgi:predicted RNA-binding protein with PIN domain